MPFSKLELLIIFAEVENTQTIDATGAFVRKPYRHICKTHQTLLMLRRSEANRDKCRQWKRQEVSGRAPAEKPPPLELRHQRTGDVVFDFIYKLIETLLPKAMCKLDSKNPLNSYGKD